MTRYALIAAGGSGSRMGVNQPKQFLQVAGKTMLEHTLSAFTEAYEDICFVIVLPASWMHLEKEIKKMAGVSASVNIATGGETRFHSVQNGLNSISEEEDALVFVHDAARCLVSPELIRVCGNAAEQYGSAIPAAEIHDSLRLINVEGTGSTPLKRSRVKAVQTPQTFQLGILKKAFQQEYQPAFTDEATVAEAAGFTVHLVPGEAGNIKVTTLTDLMITEQILANKKRR